ncbi:MAG: hypothetical protein WBP18_05070, partial [Paracoccaceae bacterium]
MGCSFWRGLSGFGVCGTKNATVTKVVDVGGRHAQKAAQHLGCVLPEAGRDGAVRPRDRGKTHRLRHGG